MIEPQYLKSKDAARWLGMSTDTLFAMRSRSEGPRYSKIGPKNIRYSVADLRAWMASNAVEPRTAAPAGARTDEGGGQ